MADQWVDVVDDQWVDVPEGGAEGGGGSDKAPSKQLIRPRAATPADEAEEKRQMALAVSGMTGGQNIAALPEDQRDAFNTKSTEKALGQGIALARGVPLTGSHIDELSALFQTGDIKGPAYEKKRTEARRAVDTAVQDNPALPTVGSLAFAPALPSTAAGRIALGTGSAYSEGVGSAPNMKEGLERGKKEAIASIPMTLLGEGMVQAGKGLGAAKAEAVEKNRAITDEMLEKAFGSARGKAGGEVSAGSNALKSAKDAVANENLPEELRRAAREWLASEKTKALDQRVVRSNLGRGEDALARIDLADDAMHAAGQNLTPEARAAAAQKRLDDPSRLLRRIRETAPKVVLPAVGGWLAGPEGAAAGAVTAAVLGRSGTTIRNMMMDPYVASRLGPVAGAIKGAGALTESAAAPIASAATDRLSPWSRFLADEDKQ